MCFSEFLTIFVGRGSQIRPIQEFSHNLCLPPNNSRSSLFTIEKTLKISKPVRFQNPKLSHSMIN